MDLMQTSLVRDSTLKRWISVGGVRAGWCLQVKACRLGSSSETSMVGETGWIGCCLQLSIHSHARYVVGIGGSVRSHEGSLPETILAVSKVHGPTARDGMRTAHAVCKS